MSPDELMALARAAQAGNAPAQKELLIELYGAVRKHVSLLIGAGAIADDAVQEAMLAIHRALPSFRGDASPRTWALSIATRIAIRLRRKESRYVTMEGTPELAAFDLGPAAAAELVLLQRALAQLDPKKRDAFVLMSVFELSASEAGRALGTFANTAASRYRHGRAELQAYLSSRRFDEIPQVAATKVRALE